MTIPVTRESRIQMKIVFCTIISILLFSGCGTSYFVTLNADNGDLSFDSFNRLIENVNVIIAFSDSTKLEANHFRIMNDSASWTDMNGNKITKMSISRIHSVTKAQNRGIGAITGLGSGLLIGGAIGTMIGSMTDDVWGAPLGAVVGGSSGALIGFGVGAVEASSDT
jgi:hypothetical protein